MIIYITIFLFFSYFFFSGKNLSNKQLFIILMLLALFVGMSDMLGGYDRYIYCELFDSCADTIEAGKNPLLQPYGIVGYKSEFGYVAWNILCSFITSNRYIFILLTTIFMYVLLFFAFKDFFEKYPFAIMMFLALSFFFTFTYLRQMMATAFAWLAYRQLVNHSRLKFLFLAILAYSFHNSAIIFFVLFFIPVKKYKRSTVLFVLALLLLVGLTGASSALYGLYGDLSETDERTSHYGSSYSTGRIDYIIEVIVFLYYIFKRYDEIPNDRKSIICLNASLMFCAILLFFVRSSTAGRQSWYYMLGLIYTISYLHYSKKQIKEYSLSLYAIMFVLYVRIVLGWGIFLSPYKTFLTNGHREGDPIYLRYEYDDNYDKDKMYRKVINLKSPSYIDTNL